MFLPKFDYYGDLLSIERYIVLTLRTGLTRKFLFLCLLSPYFG